ncbi:hypothetical protein DPX16_6634 [Anabarilius grahami]|uniref:Uncharacterized protein n=1 Tax=Anabarilius grahami TaxID=495550 RepID=A0A3N0Z1J4_ANAGA|nr:hypothetical protein DPX16_6634 [Anabarilius grahami]
MQITKPFSQIHVFVVYTETIMPFSHLSPIPTNPDNSHYHASLTVMIGTGLNWRDAVIWCLESAYPRSRTQLDPEPVPPPLTTEDRELQPAQRQPVPEDKRSVRTLAPEEEPPSESDQGCEPTTSVAEGIFVEIESEDWLMDFSYEIDVSLHASLAVVSGLWVCAVRRSSSSPPGSCRPSVTIPSPAPVTIPTPSPCPPPKPSPSPVQAARSCLLGFLSHQTSHLSTLHFPSSPLPPVHTQQSQHLSAISLISSSINASTKYMVVWACHSRLNLYRTTDLSIELSRPSPSVICASSFACLQPFSHLSLIPANPDKTLILITVITG